MKNLRNLFMTLWILTAVVPVSAGNIHGRALLIGEMNRAEDDSLDALLDEQYRRDAYAGFRLNWEDRWKNWDITIHYQVNADVGDNVVYNRKSAPYFADTPPPTLFDMTGTLHDKDKTLITHTVDRLAIGYSTPGFVMRAGRQALTWGAGKMFQVMDIVGPFAPNTVDTEYKPGVDMAYVQWLFDDGSDLQCVAAPRSKISGGDVRWDASTVAIHFRHAFNEIGTHWLISHNYENWTAGAGVSGPLNGMNWNVEVVPTFDVAGKTRVSALANISYGMMLFKRSTALFSEYYYNGFGVGGDHVIYADLPAYLTDRLVRGQVFNISRNYLSGGMTVEWTPLFSLSPSFIVNLDDYSFYGTVGAEWSIGDNTTLLMEAQIPVGSKGSEYGGIPLFDGTTPYVAPATMVYVKICQYF